MSKPKYLDCPGCIGLSDEHTCPGYAAFESMRNAKDRCRACAAKDAEIERLRRTLDNIKVRSYELGQIELHDMALATLKEANDV